MPELCIFQAYAVCQPHERCLDFDLQHIYSKFLELVKSTSFLVVD